ncbi:glycosyltransferase [Actinoplanes sp. NPDC023714]|uniref:glycosyltransferase n=1 Tax=Actinoplanes sp. NPDC023714 TaxID=3154322 RepID=UPI0033DF2E0C
MVSPAPVWVTAPAGDSRVVHVNATATGGGVAELLHRVVPAQAAAGWGAGWLVIGGDAGFFDTTKRMHHLLHGRTDPAVLDAATMARYRAVLAPQAAWLAERVTPRDVVCLHDPQTLGLAPALARAGVPVIWHCHIGTSRHAEPGPAAIWRAFAPELAVLDAVVTTLPEYAPPIPLARRHVIAPAVDLAAAKNRPLTEEEVARHLAAIGLTAGPAAAAVRAAAAHGAAAVRGAAETGGGAAGRGAAGAVVEQQAPLPDGARVVAQVSRWDPLKDMPGVVGLIPRLPADVHVVLVGADPADIPDDPEGAEVLRQVRAARDRLPADARARVHLVLTSLRHDEEAALVVNAVQRRADVVLQKCFEEGFGLAATEAMAKGRPVVAGAVGGLRHQIVDGQSGVLVDPHDPAAVASAVRRLLGDPALGRRLGAGAQARVAAAYLLPRLLSDYERLLRSLAGRPAGDDAAVKEEPWPTR